jgi:hypothetical protein
VKIADSRASLRECVIHPRIPLRTLVPAQKHISLSTLGVRNLGILLVEHRRVLFGEQWLSDATALGFSIQLPKFVHNPAEGHGSEVCAYLSSINCCTKHCVSSIWLGAFLENRRKAQEHRRPTLTCLAVLTVRIGESLRRGTGSHHNRDGVKGTVRALRVGSSKYPGFWERQSSSRPTKEAARR